MESSIKCPLCGYSAKLETIEHPEGMKLNGRDTHLWVCEECPFIGFEFWQDQNAMDVLKRLTDRTAVFTSNRNEE